MSRIEDYKRELGLALDKVAVLRAGSNLPGPRGNLELMYAAAAVGTEPELREWIGFGFPEPQDEQPTDEFLAMCGIVGLGYLAGGAGPAAAGRDEIVAELRSYASDRRWRVREAVAMALQALGDTNMRLLLGVASEWLSDRPYVQRAAVAAVSEPRLLRDPDHAHSAVDVVDAATSNLAALADRRSDEARTLRQALGYCWSVVTAAAPDYGKGCMERWSASTDSDVRWVLRENLKKNRLLRLDPAWAAVMAERLLAKDQR